MDTHLPVRQGYRLYLATLAIWSVWTAVWMNLNLSISATSIGYGWYAISLGGLGLTAGLVTTRTELFAGSRQSVERFSDSGRTAVALGAYTTALVVWSAVSVAWWTGAVALGSELVGTGWLAVAAFGLLLTVGLCVAHWSELSVAAGLRPHDPIPE